MPIFLEKYKVIVFPESSIAETGNEWPRPASKLLSSDRGLFMPFNANRRTMAQTFIKPILSDWRQSVDVDTGAVDRSQVTLSYIYVFGPNSF